MERTNLAARAGRWSAAHWKTAIGAWLVFCVVAVVVGGAVGKQALKQSDTASGDARVAQKILDGAGFAGHAGESVLVQSKTQTVSDTSVPDDGRRRRAGCLGRAGGGAHPHAARPRATAGRSRTTGMLRSFSSRFAATRTRRRTRSHRCSPRSRACRRRTRASRSPSSARRVQRMSSTTPSARTSSAPSTRRCR